MYKIVYRKQALKDLEKIKASNLKDKTKMLINLIKENPYQTPPPYEKLMGDLEGAYSRRINVQHRLIYQILDKEKTIKILRMWTHYENI